MPQIVREESEQAPSAPKCALCANVADSEVWGHPLCYAHIGQWQAACPGALELATEEDVLERRERAFGGPPIVRLKPGVEARLLEAWTRQWADQLRRAA